MANLGTSPVAICLEVGQFRRHLLVDSLLQSTVVSVRRQYLRLKYLLYTFYKLFVPIILIIRLVIPLALLGLLKINF